MFEANVAKRHLASVTHPPYMGFSIGYGANWGEWSVESLGKSGVNPLEYFGGNGAEQLVIFATSRRQFYSVPLLLLGYLAEHTR